MATTMSTATPAASPRWLRARTASTGAARQVTTCTMIDSDTTKPAVSLGSPRSRRIGASQPITL